MRSTYIKRQSAMGQISSRRVGISIPNKKHGLENPEGHHAGDMPNFTVGSDGTAKTTVTNKDVTMGEDNHSVFSNGGTALVIHAKADDMKSDPAGNAGDRIACGTVTKELTCGTIPPKSERPSATNSKRCCKNNEKGVPIPWHALLGADRSETSGTLPRPVLHFVHTPRGRDLRLVRVGAMSRASVFSPCLLKHG